jgi:hypothetical protein
LYVWQTKELEMSGVVSVANERVISPVFATHPRGGRKC